MTVFNSRFRVLLLNANANLNLMYFMLCSVILRSVVLYCALSFYSLLSYYSSHNMFDYDMLTSIISEIPSNNYVSLPRLSLSPSPFPFFSHLPLSHHHPDPDCHLYSYPTSPPLPHHPKATSRATRKEKRPVHLTSSVTFA